MRKIAYALIIAAVPVTAFAQNQMWIPNGSGGYMVYQQPQYQAPTQFSTQAPPPPQFQQIIPQQQVPVIQNTMPQPIQPPNMNMQFSIPGQR